MFSLRGLHRGFRSCAESRGYSNGSQFFLRRRVTLDVVTLNFALIQTLNRPSAGRSRSISMAISALSISPGEGL